MATHSSILAWKIPWAEAGYSPWGCKELDTTYLLNTHTHTHGGMLGFLRNAKFHELITPFYPPTNHIKVIMVCPCPLKQLMLPMLLFQPFSWVWSDFFVVLICFFQMAHDRHPFCAHFPSVCPLW